MFWNVSIVQEITYELICLIGVVPQLQNGPDCQLGPSPTSSSALRTGGTVSTEHAGDIHIPSRPTASNTLCQHDGPRWRSRDSLDPQSAAMFAQERDVGGGKRKLPSPEGGTRQSALPQPQIGKGRWWQEEEEQGLSREEGVGHMSENYINQEKRQNQDHQQSSLGKNRD